MLTILVSIPKVILRKATGLMYHDKRLDENCRIALVVKYTYLILSDVSFSILIPLSMVIMILFFMKLKLIVMGSIISINLKILGFN